MAFQTSGANVNLSDVRILEEEEPTQLECRTDLWMTKTAFQDITQSWLTEFVYFSGKIPQVKEQHLQKLAPQECAAQLYANIRPIEFNKTTAN